MGTASRHRFPGPGSAELAASRHWRACDFLSSAPGAGFHYGTAFPGTSYLESSPRQWTGFAAKTRLHTWEYNHRQQSADGLSVAAANAKSNGRPAQPISVVAGCFRLRWLAGG